MQSSDMRLRHRVAAVLLGFMAAAAAIAQTTGQAAADVNPLGLAMVRQHAETFAPGEPFQVSVTISAAAAGPITAMGLRETLPADWRLVSVAGGSGAAPDISPAPGATNLLEFAWITIPPFPYTFTYVVTPPAGDGGGKVLHGALEYRQMTGAHYAAPVMTEVKGPDPTPPTITLKGSDRVTLTVGDAWQEPGYTALDGKNRDITGKVVAGGAVDTSRAGEYTLTYAVTTDDGLRGSATRTVVVQESATPSTPNTGAVGGTAPPVPGPSGREKSNPIAASVDKNPGATAPAAGSAQSEGEGESGIKRPELPDLSAFRPPAPAPEDATAAKPGTAPQQPAAGGTPVAVPAVQHRAPVPQEMLRAAALKEEARRKAGTSSFTTPTAAPKPPSAGTQTSVMILPVLAAVGAVLALLAVLGLVGWRMVYNRPVRRKRPPTPADRVASPPQTRVQPSDLRARRFSVSRSSTMAWLCASRWFSMTRISSSALRLIW